MAVFDVAECNGDRKRFRASNANSDALFSLPRETRLRHIKNKYKLFLKRAFLRNTRYVVAYRIYDEAIYVPGIRANVAGVITSAVPMKKKIESKEKKKNTTSLRAVLDFPVRDTPNSIWEACTRSRIFPTMGKSCWTRRSRWFDPYILPEIYVA